MQKFPSLTALAMTGMILIGSAAGAQPLTQRLSTLLIEQQSLPSSPAEVAAAEQTTQTVAGLFSVELATLPVASSSGGFVYRLNPTLGVIERASQGFGPFFTETVLRAQRGQAGFGIRYQFATFGSLQGADLQAGTFPTNATREVGAAQPFSVDTLELTLESRITSFVGSYGVTDRLSVGGTLPIATVRFSGTRTRSLNGSSFIQSIQSGSATGLGDVLLNTRYRLTGESARGVALGGDLRLPTGRQEDLLGAGKASLRVLALGSWEDGQLAVNVNGGFGLGGISRELFWATATTFAVTPRITAVGEVVGRRLSALSRLQDIYQPYAGATGLETMRWLPVETGIGTAFLATGAKVNVTHSLLLNASVLIRLTDAGLRARVTPTLSLDYDFQR